MGTRDKNLMEWTKPVWNELCEADCNPDIIPFSLCDACEIGWNTGFHQGLVAAGIIGVSAAIGIGIYKFVTRKKDK